MPHTVGEEERRTPACKPMENPLLPRDASRQGKKDEYRDKLHLFLAVLPPLPRHLVFPGRPGAKVAWEGRREPPRQPISWTDPMMWLKVLPPDEPSVLVCVRGVVLACA